MIFTRPQFSPESENANSGGGTPATPDATALAEATELQTLTNKEATTLNDQEKTRLTELQTKYEVVLKDDKGNPLTPDQIKAHKENEVKFNTIAAKPEEQRTQEEKDFLKANTAEEEKPTKSIYEQVDELTGKKYEIDYEGVDPLTPEGVILREQVIEEASARKYDQSIKTKYPRAYQYMLHLSQGGKEEDFFKPENQDFLVLTVKKDDPQGQERILRTALAAKGNSPAIIDAAVNALKDGQLYETAKSELEALQQNQKQRDIQREQLAESRKQRETLEINNFSDQLESAIENGFEGVKIPQADREKFGKFIFDQLDYNNGRFLMIKQLDPKELNKVLRTAYFDFKGGDLKGLVDRSAASKLALKFKSNIKADVVPKGATAGNPKNRVSLGAA